MLNRCPDLVVSSPPCFMYAMMRSTSRPIYLAKLIDIHPSKRTTKKFRHNSVMDSLLHPGRIATTLRGFRQGSPPFPLHVLACPQLLPRRLLFPPHESYFLDYLDSLRDKDTATSTKVMVLEFSLGFFMFLYCFFPCLYPSIGVMFGIPQTTPCRETTRLRNANIRYDVTDQKTRHKWVGLHLSGRATNSYVAHRI